MRNVALLALLAALGTGSAQAAEPPAYDRFDAMVAMSDGVRLDASLYIPKQPASARLPLIVRHHGGGSNKESPFDVSYGLRAVATNRFALLMYSHRGHGASEGFFDFFGQRTTRDFSEMLDWVAASHGDRIDTDKVGAAGYSQGGGESLLPAAHDARVRALAVGNTFADLNHALNPNDCYKFAFATGIFVGAYTVTASRVELPLVARWGAQLMSDTEDIPTLLFPSTTGDLAARSPQTYVQALIDRRVPVFWTNAWEDQLFPADHPERMLSLLDAQDVPVHYWFASGGHAAGASFPAEEAAREQAMLDWFEQFLHGTDMGYTRGHKVTYWQRVTGAPRKPGEWQRHGAENWPIPGAVTASFHPRADGSLATGAAPPDEAAALLNDYVSLNVANDALVLELANNVPGMGDVLAQIPESQNPLDTIRFTSAALTQPLDVVGAPVVTVALDSTAAVVQQLSAKVWDLSEAGAQLIWRGASSGAPGEEVSFKLWPNAHRFEPGHRIVLTISSVDFPTFKPDIEPWRANVLLAGTRLDLPTLAKAATPPGAAPGAEDGDSGGGCTVGKGRPDLSLLAVLLLLLLRSWQAALRRAI